MTYQSSQFTDIVLPLFEAVPTPSRTEGDTERKRLTEHFMNNGPEAVPDYDILTLILHRAIPDPSVKAIAVRLLAKFGDFNHVISAPRARLLEIEGVTRAILEEFKIVETAAHRLARAKIMDREVLSSWDALLDYCQTRMAHLSTEQFRVLFLDRKNVLIADEAQGAGTVDHVPVYPREIIKRALELNASAFILVHNHPSGDPTPSPEDIAMTKTIQNAGDVLGVVLHDHLVIGKSRHMSMRAEGLI